MTVAFFAVFLQVLKTNNVAFLACSFCLTLEKHVSEVFSLICASFRTITYVKAVEFLSSFLCNSFVEPETKESFWFSKQ